MSVQDVDDIERLKKINAALIARVERSIDQQGNAFSLFQTAINLENRIRSRTEELNAALRRLEDANHSLIAAKEAAEQANLSKTRFLAAASHDVLQPLNAAHLHVSALAEVQTSEEGKRLVRQVERSLDTMDELLRTLLDISKLDAGVVTPNLSDVELSGLFRQLQSDFLPIAQNKGLKLRFRPTERAIRSDRSLLLRILQNIISNAIRYTDAGGVLVALRRSGPAPCIEVWDTGSGIPENEQVEVFEEFHRGVAVSEQALSGGGLGLGLSIVKRIATTLDYQVKLKSRPGKGTVFRVKFPAATVFETAPRPSNKVHSAERGYGLFGARIMLLAQPGQEPSGLRKILDDWNCLVRHGVDAREALAGVDKGAWAPDIIIADELPEQAEHGDCAIVEARKILGQELPAVLVTRNPTLELRQSASAQSIEVMNAPVKPAQLRAMLAHLLA